MTKLISEKRKNSQFLKKKSLIGLAPGLGHRMGCWLLVKCVRNGRLGWSPTDEQNLTSLFCSFEKGETIHGFKPDSGHGNNIMI